MTSNVDHDSAVGVDDGRDGENGEESKEAKGEDRKGPQSKMSTGSETGTSTTATKKTETMTIASTSSSTSSSPPGEILRSDCGACERCVSLLLGHCEVSTNSDGDRHDAPSSAAAASDETETETPEDDEDGRRCRICLGLLSCPKLWEETVSSVVDALRPYGTLPPHPEVEAEAVVEDADAESGDQSYVSGSSFTAETPTVSIPSTIMLRAHAASCHVDIALSSRRTDGENGEEGENDSRQRQRRCCSALTFHGRVKADVKSRILTMLSSRSKKGGTRRPRPTGGETLAPVLEGDDGLMNVHVLYLQSDAFPDGLPCVDPKHRLNQRRNRRNKRSRGGDPTPMQGGDPRSNLEANARIRVKRISWRRRGNNKDEKTNGEEHDKDEDYYPSAAVVERAISSPVGTMDSTRIALAKWITSNSTTYSPCSVHVAAWRSPFYVGGRYTKSRRDVAQTPFYVRAEGVGGKDEGSGMVRRGVTSVEEQICPALAEACGGISVSNNAISPEDDDDCGVGTTSTQKVVYGMCKFHASGREDVDVRMMARVGGPLGGRPFVCEVVDALCVPTREGLDRAVRAINGMEDNDGSDDEIWVDGFYGRNTEGGVGVDSLTFTISSRYRGLQSETENKVKHYGCTCWSQRPIDNQETLDRLLTRDTPTPIVQSTPIRVLHRRSYAERDRTVLRMRAVRTDEHRFHLSLSTTAGTYVKEFVHGDLGRTRPSVASILGCRADITDLDCEGIEVGG